MRWEALAYDFQSPFLAAPRNQAMTDMLESANNDTTKFYVRDRDNMTASSNHLQSHGGGFGQWRFCYESYESAAKNPWLSINHGFHG